MSFLEKKLQEEESKAIIKLKTILKKELGRKNNVEHDQSDSEEFDNNLSTKEEKNNENKYVDGKEEIKGDDNTRAAKEIPNHTNI